MSPAEFHAWLAAGTAGTAGAERRPLVMGVLNVTPDSFSDGGRFAAVEAAVAHAHAMAAEGADLIDVGGESTRPGSQRVPAEEQLRRVVPVFEALAKAPPPAVLSIDTTRAEVAEACLDRGAAVVNDISAGLDDGRMLPTVASRGAAVVLMHMRGQPATMQVAPTYADVVAEVTAFLRGRLAAAVAAGVDAGRVLLDPGIGFGKTVDHNLALLREVGRMGRELGRPLVVGTSRKAFVGRITGEAEPSGRVFGTAASVAWVAGANVPAVVRVHDVGPMAKVVRMVRAIATGRWDDGPGQAAAAPAAAGPASRA